MKFKTFLERFKNTGTVITLASLVILILTTNGVIVDNERIMTTVEALCSIGIVLGIMYKPAEPEKDEKEEQKEVGPGEDQTL